MMNQIEEHTYDGTLDAGTVGYSVWKSPSDQWWVEVYPMLSAAAFDNHIKIKILPPEAQALIVGACHVYEIFRVRLPVRS